MIKVQEEDFSLTDEIIFLKKRCNNIGALSTFIGIVRDKREDEKLISMTLEHYPGMTEKMLNKINTEALSRWDLLDTTIIHRYGKLLPGEQIVLVITASKHSTADGIGGDLIDPNKIRAKVLSPYEKQFLDDMDQDPFGVSSAQFEAEIYKDLFDKRIINIESTINSLENVEAVNVDIDQKSVEVNSSSDLDLSLVSNMLDEQGYTVVESS